MEKLQWIVQASSRSWSGARDICTNSVRGKSALYNTLSRIFENFPSSRVVVAAPEFDRAGEFPAMLANFPYPVDLYFGYSESPLKRMLAAHDAYLQDDAFLRIDALNMAFQEKDLRELWRKGVTENLDCAKFPDDYPVQFTADFYRATALLRLSQTLPSDSPFQVHPKYALLRDQSFLTAFYKPQFPISDAALISAREDAEAIYVEPRDMIGTKRIAHGDRLGFHYEVALSFIESSYRVLDIACGGWYGPDVLARKAKNVIGADIDAECIIAAQSLASQKFNLDFRCEDVTATTFPDSSFDAVTSFETIEHVDELSYLIEIHRILKPNGLFLLSTPQNSQGHIPVNPHHRLEYSLDGICTAVSPLFNVVHIFGFKQGCIFFNDDPVGTNTFMVLRSKVL